jgi:hypothetical protein
MKHFIIKVLHNPSKPQPEDVFIKKAETCCCHDFLNYLLNIFYVIKVVSD